MTPTILTIRAIGAEFARRTYRFVLILTSCIAVLIVASTLWLTTFSQWWWLLMFAVVSGICVAISVLTVFKLTINKVTPKQNPVQKRAVGRFVTNIQAVSDIAGTPKFILLFQLIKDIAAPREQGFIGSTINTSKELRDDLKTLITLFSEK